jgi:hypothetical protein
MDFKKEKEILLNPTRKAIIDRISEFDNIQTSLSFWLEQLAQYDRSEEFKQTIELANMSLKASQESIVIAKDALEVSRRSIKFTRLSLYVAIVANFVAIISLALNSSREWNIVTIAVILAAMLLLSIIPFDYWGDQRGKKNP